MDWSLNVAVALFALALASSVVCGIAVVWMNEALMMYAGFTFWRFVYSSLFVLLGTGARFAMRFIV